jgi:2,4-dienoyl-CoA reductase (NADPH2)
MFFDAEPVDRLKEFITRGTSTVTIIEMLPTIGKDVGRSTRWILNLEIEKFGINVITSAKVTEITDDAVIYEKDTGSIAQKFDNVIIAVGSKPVNPLESELQKAGIAYTALGDCKKIGKINDAVHQAFLAVAHLQQVAKV